MLVSAYSLADPLNFFGYVLDHSLKAYPAYLTPSIESMATVLALCKAMVLYRSALSDLNYQLLSSNET